MASGFYYYYFTLLYFIPSLHDVGSIFHESWADYGAILLSLVVVVIVIVEVAVIVLVLLPFIQQLNKQLLNNNNNNNNNLYEEYLQFNIPETNHVYRVYIVAAVRFLQFLLDVMLFSVKYFGVLLLLLLLQLIILLIYLESN